MIYITFCICCFFFFFFNDTATTEIYTLSLHDALPISRQQRARRREDWGAAPCAPRPSHPAAVGRGGGRGRRRGGRRVSGWGGGSRGRSRGGAAAGGERGEGGEGGGDGREGAQPHGRPVRAKGPMCGPVNSEATSSRNASTSRVSSGAMIASTYPLAPANLASSCRS